MFRVFVADRKKPKDIRGSERLKSKAVCFSGGANLLARVVVVDRHERTQTEYLLIFLALFFLAVMRGCGFQIS